MKRRNFIKISTGTILSAPILYPKFNSVFAQNKPKVYSALHPGAALMQKTTAFHLSRYPVDVVSKFEMDDGVLTQMVNSTIIGVTGIKELGKAWESLFPAGKLNGNTKVSIKINTAYGEGEPDKKYNNGWEDKMCPVGPKPCVINAVVYGLSKMLDGTFPVNNITIFDVHGAGGGPARMASQGFAPSGSSKDYIIQETNKNPRFELYDRAKTPADAPSFEAGTAGNMTSQRLIPPLYNSNFSINIATPKVHQAAGISGVIKNTFGCTHDCSSTHSYGIASGAPGVMHCAPGFYREQNKLVPTIINIYDAIGITWDGNGPHWGRFALPNIIAASTDPVALDSYGLQIINKARVENGLHALAGHDTGVRTDNPMKPWGLFPGSYNEDNYINADFLKIAAEEYSLGSTEYDLQTLDLSSIHFDLYGRFFFGIQKISKQGNYWHLVLNAGRIQRTSVLKSRIFNLKGMEIKTFLPIRTRSQIIELDWDGKGNNGFSVSNGPYCWEVQIDGYKFTRLIQHF